MSGTFTSAAFAALGFALPLSYGTDGEIIDANDNVVCVVDHNNEMPDDRVAQIAALIVGSVNFFDGDVEAAQ